MLLEKARGEKMRVTKVTFMEKMSLKNLTILYEKYAQKRSIATKGCYE